MNQTKGMLLAHHSEGNSLSAISLIMDAHMVQLVLLTHPTHTRKHTHCVPLSSERSSNPPTRAAGSRQRSEGAAYHHSTPTVQS